MADEESNINHYNFEPNVVPPYVLDSVAKAHLNNSNEAANQQRQVSHDLFISSIQSNWKSFINTIASKNSNLVKSKTILFDHPGDSSLEEYKLPDLSGTWQGDLRLKKILNEEATLPQEGHRSDGIFSTWFKSGRSNKFVDGGQQNPDSPKIRSSAKYWMSTEQRGTWQPQLKHVLLFSPYLLVTLRSLMFVFGVAALALAASVYKDTKDSKINGIGQQPSTIMAIVVQTIALVYLVYVTWDEYSGKPIGLRNPVGKIKLILLDLLFIIFGSANLSLAYNTLYDNRWLCVREEETISKRMSLELVKRILRSDVNSRIASICEKQRGLSAFLFIMLCMWVFTFTMTIFRVVDRVSSPKN